MSVLRRFIKRVLFIHNLIILFYNSYSGFHSIFLIWSDKKRFPKSPKTFDFDKYKIYKSKKTFEPDFV